MTMLRRHWLWILAFVILLAIPFLFYDWGKGRHSGFVLTLMSEIGVMAIFALSYNMLMGQAGLLSFGHAVLLGMGAYCAAHVVLLVKAGTIWLPTELVPLAGGLGGLFFGYRVRLAGDQAARHGVCHDHDGTRRTGFGRGADVHGLLRRRRRHPRRPRDGYQPVRRQLLLAVAGLLPGAGLGLHRRRADEAANPDPARQHGQRHPRQFRARAVRRLRSAHGAALSVRAVRLLRRHRRRALCADLRNRHLRYGVGRRNPPTRCSRSISAAPAGSSGRSSAPSWWCCCRAASACSAMPGCSMSAFSSSSW